jgi:carbonic anhydrase
VPPSWSSVHNPTIANDYDARRGKPPAPRIAIVTCADPRLTDIVPMLGLADGDVDMIRNVGTVIDDDSVRSLSLLPGFWAPEKI